MSPQNPGPPPVSRAVAVTGGGAAAAANFATIQDTLRDNRGAEARAIQAMFGGDKDLMQRFLAVAFSALASNSDLLLNATPMSILQSIKDAAALGLEPTGLNGEGVIIRYGDTAQFQPMWRGYLKRIRNSRKVVDIDCQMVFMNDEFDLRLGTDPSIHHVPILVGETDEEGNPTAERGGYRGVYAWALMPSGKYIIEWMTEADINAVRDHFSTGFKRRPNDNPWTTSWAEMARKTVLRRLAKRLPGEAVDQLLIADAQADAAADALKAATKEANESVSQLRTVALRAVGQIEAGKGQEDKADGAGDATEGEGAPAQSDAEKKLISDAAAGDPGEAGEPEMACRVPSPYGDGQFCVLFKGHGGNHRAADKSSWA